MARAPIDHIWVDERGEAWIDDTTYKVKVVVADHLYHGFSPAEIRYQHYNALSLAQIHAALAYYFDHQVEIDAQVETELQEYEERWKKSLNSPIHQKLRALGKTS